MNITYTNTVADVLRFQLFHIFRTPIGLLFALPLAVPLGYYTWVAIRTALDQDESLLVAVFSVVFGNLAILVVVIPPVAALSLVAAWLSARSMSILTEHTITLSDDGLLEVTPLNRSEHSWPGVERIRQSRRYIYLYVTGCSAYIIPKRAFGSTDATQRFVEFATKSWQEHRRAV